MQKRWLTPKYTLSDTDLEISHKRFSGDGWVELRQQFDIYNTQFFNGMLPKVLILCGSYSDAVGGLCFGRAIFISKDDPFVMNCKLLHEMLHLANMYRNVYDYDHGFGWIESMIPIHEALNINANIYEFSEDDAIGWPHIMFGTHGIKSYFQRCFLEHGCLKPLPTGWVLERSPPADKITKKTVVLQADPVEDLKVLEETFGLEYAEKIIGGKRAI